MQQQVETLRQALRDVIGILNINSQAGIGLYNSSGISANQIAAINELLARLNSCESDFERHHSKISSHVESSITELRNQSAEVTETCLNRIKQSGDQTVTLMVDKIIVKGNEYLKLLECAYLGYKQDLDERFNQVKRH